MLRNKKRNDGFTLVEIIVVLLIIGILLAITIPSIMGYVEKAHDAKIEAQTRPMFLESQTYATEMFGKYGTEGKPINDDSVKTETVKLINADLIEKFRNEKYQFDDYTFNNLSIFYDGFNELNKINTNLNVQNHEISKIGFVFQNTANDKFIYVVMISNDEIKVFHDYSLEIYDKTSKWYFPLF